MFEGNLHEGELEIGQIASTIHEMKPVKDIIKELIEDYQRTVLEIPNEL